MSWGSYGTIYYAQGVGVNRRENVFIADTGNNRIQKYTSDGVSQLAWGSYGSGNGLFSGPRGVAGDIKGDVSWRILVITVSRNLILLVPFLYSWSGYSPGSGRLYGPGGLAVGRGNLYVADTLSNRILVFKTPGFSLPLLELLLKKGIGEIK